MIPKFPNFKKLELSDKTEIERFTSKFLPYSDFNFSSMWGWDTYQKMKLSQLNKNLVVLFNDYISGKSFLSFIGKNKVSETASKLISFSKDNYHTNLLKLIPEEAAETLDKSEFAIMPDRDSYDYIYSVAHLIDINNLLNDSSIKKIKQFIKLYHNYIIKESSIKEIIADEHKYERMFRRWAQNKKINNYFDLNEFKALKRFFKINNDNIRAVSLYIDKFLAGFTIYETLSKDYAISHFAKADAKFHSAVYNILNREEAKILNARGIKYFNYEQDLGIQELRKSKEKYKPSFFLKKYIVIK